MLVEISKPCHTWSVMATGWLLASQDLISSCPATPPPATAVGAPIEKTALLPTENSVCEPVNLYFEALDFWAAVGWVCQSVLPCGM